METIQRIAQQFQLDGEILSIKAFGSGHVNKTFLVETTLNKYVLQKINVIAFNNPDALMSNLAMVTEHLKSKGIETMNFIKTKTGQYIYQQGDVYRLYVFVDDVIVYDNSPDKEVFAEAGWAFGNFINELSELDASLLHETIKDFHNTPKRFLDFIQAVENDAVGRVKDCQSEIEYIKSKQSTLGVAVQELKNGTLPLRVTHNDTKLNNILIDKKTLKPRAVIDLDTVMPGSMLYDFGDAIRFGASTAAEDEKDLSKVNVDKDMYKAFTKGFCNAVKQTITKREAELLPYGAYLMTIECGMRFLTDYLKGDEYFSIAYPEHNLVRARTQLKLAVQLEEYIDQAKDYVFSVLEKF